MGPIPRLLCYKWGSGGFCDNTQPTVATEISRGKHHFVKQVPSPISQDAYRNLQMCLFLRRMRPRRSRIGRGRVNCYNGGNRNFPGKTRLSANFSPRHPKFPKRGNLQWKMKLCCHFCGAIDERNSENPPNSPGNFCCHRCSN